MILSCGDGIGDSANPPPDELAVGHFHAELWKKRKKGIWDTCAEYAILCQCHDLITCLNS